MKITQVTYQRGRTINVGNYESVKLEIGLTADVDSEDTVPEVLGELRRTVLSELTREAKAVRELAKARNRTA